MAKKFELINSEQYGNPTREAQMEGFYVEPIIVVPE